MKRPLPWLLRGALSIALLAAIIHQIDARPISDALSSANPWFLLAALLLLVPNITLQHAKWRLLLRGGAPMVQPGDVRASLFGGFTLGMLTPARIGEFGGRAVLCRGAGKGLLVSLTAVDKAGTMLVTVVVGLFTLVHFSSRSDVLPTLPIVISGLLILTVLLGFLALLTHRTSTAPRRFLEAKNGRVARHLLQLMDTMAAMSPASLRMFLLYSVLFYLTFVLQFMLLLSAFVPMHPLDAFSGIATIMLVKTVIPPVTIGELGIREGASVFILSVYGVVSAVAFSASLLLFSINILLPAIAGLWFLLRRRAAGAFPL